MRKDEQLAEKISIIYPRFVSRLKFASPINRLGLNLTVPQVFTLFILNTKGVCTTTQLATELGVSLPNITGIITRLEKKGIVKREISPEDRRKILIKMTPKGGKLLLEFKEMVKDTWSRILEGVSVKDQEIFARILEKITQNLTLKEKGER